MGQTQVRHRSALMSLWLLASANAGAAQAPATDLARLANSSLEQLMQIKVTTVAGSPQSRMSTPAAITVISGDEIRRSGHRTIVEALRLVPGMYVGQVNSSSWLAGSRGLTGSALTATRYLVLIDGREVYDPLTSTTFWNTVDTVLEDIDRIEVIRGPGATLWGVNAMNGVINIVTKSSADTLGNLVQLGAGNEDRAEIALRHGAPAGADGNYRVWLKYASHGAFENAAGNSVQDQWSTLRAGFRYDQALDARTQLTVQGDAYTQPRASESVQIPLAGQDRQFETRRRNDDIDGGNLLLRINRGFGEPDGWRLRVYVDHSRFDNTRFMVQREKADADFRDWMHWGKRNDLMWGAEYQWTRDRTGDGPVLFFDPANRAWFQANVFLQNTTEVIDGRLFVMLGSKFTYHSFIGFKSQPSARVWWTPSEKQTIWAAVSRPVRMPSRFEENGQLVLAYVDLGAITTGTANGIIIPLTVSGDPDLRAEQLTAYELGHRWRVNDRWLLESSFFYNDYQRLIEPVASIYGPFTDAGTGSTYGAEINASGQITDRWRVESSYAWLRTRIDGPVYQFEERSSPRNMAQLRSYLDIGDTLEFNAAAYYVDRIPQLNIGAHTRLDLGLSWQANARTRIELWGQNLLEGRHAEASGAMVPRGVFARLTFEPGR